MLGFDIVSPFEAAMGRYPPNVADSIYKAIDAAVKTVTEAEQKIYENLQADSGDDYDGMPKLVDLSDSDDELDGMPELIEP